ncbi:glycoside hydrolase family 2 TIM barrel-domain containing protein [Massilia phosphatilytica]
MDDPAPLYFGAVNYEAHVYLNGKKLGMHKGGFTPFQFDVTDKLAKGRNVVVVKADNTRHQDDIPTLNTDWWNYGGITRDVMLAELPATYIADYKVQLAKGDAHRIDGFIQMAGDAKSQQVTVTIPEAGIKATVRTDANGRAALNIPVNKLTYWSPQQPKLYTVELAGGGDDVVDHIGFRTIETRGQDILLNGKSVFLRGISLHDENPLIPGRLRGQGDMRMLLQWAKEMNCNYVRLAHYPHNEEMIRLADEMGLMVWAEVPVYWTISWTNPDTYANANAQLTDLVTRDKNRASVIVWSVGNETPVSAPRNTFMGNLAKTARSLDDTRLVAAALEIHRKGSDITVEDPLADSLDLASFNEYAGWYWASNAEMLNYRFDVRYNKPVVITEFGASALGGSSRRRRHALERGIPGRAVPQPVQDAVRDPGPARDDAVGARRLPLAAPPASVFPGLLEPQGPDLGRRQEEARVLDPETLLRRRAAPLRSAGRALTACVDRGQSRSGAPSGNRERYGRASSTARANDGRASRRAR